MLASFHCGTCIRQAAFHSQNGRSACKDQPSRLQPCPYLKGGFHKKARHLRSQASAALKPLDFLKDIRKSALLSPELYSVSSWSYAALCFAAAASSLAAFNLLAQSMVESAVAGGFTGDTSQLSFLDLHDGYSPEEARALLEAWGPHGRHLYLLVETIDCTLYHTGYRGFLVVVANRLAGALRHKWPPVAPLAALAALPVLLAGVDFLEDTGQVAMVFAYEKGIAGAEWEALVGVASFINQSKWALCRFTLTALASEAAVLAGLAYLPRMLGESRSTEE